MMMWPAGFYLPLTTVDSAIDINLRLQMNADFHSGIEHHCSNGQLVLDNRETMCESIRDHFVIQSSQKSSKVSRKSCEKQVKS